MQVKTAMIAVDTNVLIRLVIFDDPMQSDISDELIRNNRVFVSKGVLMESSGIAVPVQISA